MAERPGIILYFDMVAPLKRLGYENHILSASPTTGRQNVNGRTVRLDEQTVLELLEMQGVE